MLKEALQGKVESGEESLGSFRKNVGTLSPLFLYLSKVPERPCKSDLLWAAKKVTQDE